VWTTGKIIMLQAIDLLSNPDSKFSSNAVVDFYKQAKNIPNTIISIQYNYNKLLTFKVYEATKGVIVHRENKEAALQCKIRGISYTLTREHLKQMSNRECQELFNHLGIDGKQLF